MKDKVESIMIKWLIKLIINILMMIAVGGKYMKVSFKKA